MTLEKLILLASLFVALVRAKIYLPRERRNRGIPGLPGASTRLDRRTGAH